MDNDYSTQALWPQMVQALAAIDDALGLPQDGCNSTAQTLRVIHALRNRQPAWRPIETYDRLKKKPKLAVFWFEGTPPARGMGGSYDLNPFAGMHRNFGSRVCTHWMPLPDAPEPGNG